MATTTTIRLSEDLKARIASAAERVGKSTHSFILEAIAEKTELEEQRAGFDEEANARFAKIVESGKTIPWTDLRHYLEARLEGKQISRPVAKTKRE
ncbi:CopG family ribbon-helix-helix protein [Massilia sp. TSP1-1-2]|uniref:CopG family ribbon-helix-helix protein n=1 Tax=unclassified Massilia TaxID=2609279 RepID=UPI003CED02AC